MDALEVIAGFVVEALETTYLALRWVLPKTDVEAAVGFVVRVMETTDLAPR